MKNYKKHNDKLNFQLTLKLYKNINQTILI